MNEIIYTSVLGLVQGLTELWPISSSGHLLVIPFLVGKQDFGLTITVFLHGGTLIALLIYFRKELISLLKPDKRRLFLVLLVSIIPAGLAGILLEDYIETIFRSPLTAGINLIVFGLILLWADRHKGSKKIKDIGFREAILIGLSQILALVPGVSRSGITTSTGLFLGQKKVQAARFSFLMLAPILLGATILRSVDFLTSGVNSQPVSLAAIIIGLVTSFVFSYLALVFLFRWLNEIGYWPFVIYRIILGLIVILIYL